jgi:hypothetical protein
MNSPLISSRQIDPDELRQRVARGDLVRIRQGMYIASNDASRLLDTRVALALRAQAVASALSAPFAFSHTTAAALWGIPLWKPDSVIHVRQQARYGAGHANDIIRHHGLPDVVSSLNDLPLTTPEQTVIDCLRTMSVLEGLVIADAAIGRDVVAATLTRELDALTGMRGVRRASRVLGFADSGAQSPWETWRRYSVIRLGLPRPVTQYPVRVGSRTFYLDLFCPKERVWLEFDGATKYDDFAYGSDKTGRQALLAEKEREDLLVDTLGIRPLRVRATHAREPQALAERILKRFPTATRHTARPIRWMPVV